MYGLPRIGSATTSTAPSSGFTTRATSSDPRMTSFRLRPSTRTPIGVLTPVASMSTRFWIGIVQTLVQAGHLHGQIELAAKRGQLVAVDLPEYELPPETFGKLGLNGVEGGLGLQERARGMAWRRPRRDGGP